jgi:hypothetical protein
MNDIEYIFEGHDLTKEVVMVQVRDNPDRPWSVPRQLGMVCPTSKYPFVPISHECVPMWYRYARLAKQTIKPWTLETAPRHIEVELEKGCFYVAIIKTEDFVTFLKDGELYNLTWKALAAYNQWDGSQCVEVVE